jgi:hypothetical protein
MKKRGIIILKIIAWAPLFLVCMALFVPYWFVTDKSTMDWFNDFDNSIFEKEPMDWNKMFNPPPPPPRKYEYPETPVDDPQIRI